MFARLRGTEIDLTKTKFDPANPAHVAAINEQINVFNDASLSLFKKDLLMSMGTGLVLFILWATGWSGVIYQSVALAACATIIWASDLWKKRVTENQECRNNLSNLLGIYRRCIADHGYQITGHSAILELLKAIAPYVPTEALWAMSTSNPDHYPVGFKQVLSSPPHRIPFGDSQPAESPVLSMLSSVLPMMPVHQVDIAAVPVNQFGELGAVSLFKKVAADTRQTVYGLDVKQLSTILSNKR